MKLNELLKKIDSTPKLYGNSTLGHLALEKGCLKERLKVFFKDPKIETGITIDAKGVVIPDET